MKKVLFLFAIAAFTFWGCDYVVVPNQPHTAVVPSSDTVRKIFIEDFTGHTCPNCPKASRKLDSLRAAFPERIIGMAVHIAYFAEPCDSNPHYPPAGALPGTFLEDFRTAEDADYESIYSCSTWPYPNGILNRKPDPINGNLPTAYDDWGTSAAVLLQDSMTAYLKITPSYTSSSRTLNVSVSGEFLCDTTGSYNIALYLVEDGLIASQTDGTVINNSYVFNDVFRGCINSPGFISGQPISTPTTITGHTPISYTFNNFHVNSNFVDSNCKIIAILINNADRGVLQAAECNLQ